MPQQRLNQNAPQLPGSTRTVIANGSSHIHVITPPSPQPTLDSGAASHIVSLGTSHSTIPSLPAQPPYTQPQLTQSPDYSRNSETQAAERYEPEGYAPPSHLPNGVHQEQLVILEKKIVHPPTERAIPAENLPPVHQNPTHDVSASQPEIDPPSMEQAHHVTTPVEVPVAKPPAGQESPAQKQLPDKNPGDKKKNGQN